MTKRKVASQKEVAKATSKAFIYMTMKNSKSSMLQPEQLSKMTHKYDVDEAYVSYRRTLQLLHEMEKDGLVKSVGSQLCGYWWYLTERIHA